MGIIDWVVGKVKNAFTSLKNMFFVPEQEKVEEYDTDLKLDNKNLSDTFIKTRKAIEEYLTVIEEYSPRTPQGFPLADRFKKIYDSSERQAIDAVIEKLEKEIAILKEIKKKGKKSKSMRLSENAILKEIKKKGMPMPLTGSEYAYLVEVSFRLTIVCKKGGEIVRMGDVKYVKKVSSTKECEDFVHEAISSSPYHVGDTIDSFGESCFIVAVEPIVEINGIKFDSGTESRKQEGLLKWTENV